MEKQLGIYDLIQQLEEAKTGKAKVDKVYVDYNHNTKLFDYNIDYAKFINNITYILKKDNNG